MALKKTWTEKLSGKKNPEVKQIDVAFAGIPANSRMLIPTPLLVDAYIRQIDKGQRVAIPTLRKDLAIQHQADYTCPVTTGIFLRIVAEAAYEQWQQGSPLKQITPFWRVIEPGSPTAKKLSFGEDFLRQQIAKEVK